MLRFAAVALAFLAAVLLVSVNAPVEAQETKDKPAAEKKNVGAPPKSETPAPNPQPSVSNEVYERSFKALFALFVIATVLESGLAVIFNWRRFIQLFDTAGVKTLVAVVFAYLVVERFNLDLVTDLVNIYTPSDPKFAPGAAGKFITALVIAGGSAGVNKLLMSLGFRSVKTAEQITQKPPPDKAWIAVRLLRDKAVGPVEVLLGPDGAQAPVVGSITGSSSQSGIARFFLRDYGRFPTTNGHAIIPDPAKVYRVSLVGRDKDGAAISSPAWGPNALAPGAIVDIELKL